MARAAGLEVAAAALVAAFARIRSPRGSRFTRSARKATGRARRAFRENGPGDTLMTALGSAATFFTLTVSELDPSLSDDPSGLYDRATMRRLFDSTARAFRGPVYAVAEVGKGSHGRRGRLHLHVVGHRDDGPAHIPRDSRRCQPVYDPFGMYRYLSKPPEPYSLEAALDAAAARVLSPSGRLPNTRQHRISPERLAFLEASYCPKNQTPQTASQTAPRTTPNASHLAASQ